MYVCIKSRSPALPPSLSGLSAPPPSWAPLPKVWELEGPALYLSSSSPPSPLPVSSWFSITWYQIQTDTYKQKMENELESAVVDKKALELCPNLTLKLPVQTWYSYWVVLFNVRLLCAGFSHSLLCTASILRYQESSSGPHFSSLLTRVTVCISWLSCSCGFNVEVTMSAVMFCRRTKSSTCSWRPRSPGAKPARTPCFRKTRVCWVSWLF